MSRIKMAGAILLLTFAQLSILYGQVGRATVTGIVRDTTGAVMPGVPVIVINVQTHAQYDTATNDVGNYSLGNLPIGEYALSFTAAGFKPFTRSGLNLTAGQVARIDMVLQVGEASETLTVSAQAPLLQSEVAQASKSVESSIFQNLALSFSSGGRNMGSFAAALVPGVSRSNWQLSIQGTPAGTGAIIIDGMNNLAGYLPGDFAEDSISPEAVEELTVFTGNVTADLGRTAGGALNFSLKSGTNQLHGSGMYALRNEVLDANDWNNNRLLAADPNLTNPSTRSFLRPKDRRKDFAGSFGGPVYIPKIYNGKDKTFFYFTMERYLFTQTGPAGLTSSVPLPEMWDGNLSRLLTGQQAGTDVLGRPVYVGQVYDPTTLRQVNGQFVADPFYGNIIPVSRMSKVAQTIKPIFSQYYQPVTNTVTNNLYWTNFNQQTVNNQSVKVDHSFSSKHKVAGNWYRNSLPIYKEDVGGIWSLVDPTTGGPLSRGRLQNRRAFSFNVAHDWIISPSMLNHLSFGINDNKAGAQNVHLGADYHDQWGIKGASIGQGLPISQIGPPTFALGGSPVVSYGNWGGGDNADNRYRSYNISNVLSWQHHSHTFKFGADWSDIVGQQVSLTNAAGTFNFSSRTTGIPGQSYTSQTGNSFASFLLGLVDSANVTPMFIPNVNRRYAAVFAQDTWKVTPKLTLNIGMRWSGNTPIYESQNLMASFNPYLADPNASNMLGAVEYMGTGPGLSGKRSPASSDWKDFGPTFGLAYQINSNSVLRMGYGLTFTPESIATGGGGWGLIPGGFSGGLRPTDNVAADSKGIYIPVFNIDNGYPGATQTVGPDPSWGEHHGSAMISPDIAKAGYVQHFNLGLQREVAKDLLVEVEWRADKGTRLHMSLAGNMVRPNQIQSQYLSKGAVLGQIISTPGQAAAAGLPYPYAGWSGTGANTLMPFPQITTQGLSAYGDTVGFSTYQSGNLIVTKRMSKGVSLYGAYTLSKVITNARDIMDNLTVPVQDTYNRQKGLSPDDRTHVVKISAVWDLPAGRGKPLLRNSNRLVSAIVSGWSVSAILNYSSGTPLGVPGSLTTPVGWNGPGVFANFATPAGGFKSLWDPSKFNPWDPNDPGNRFFDKTAFSSALSQQLGNSPTVFPQLRMPFTWNENASVMKGFRVHERLSFSIRLELFNLFNRHYFGAPDMNMNDPYFGNIRTASGARNGQFGIRMDW